MSLAPQGPAADVNGDWVVDIFDVNVVSAHWGEAGPTGDANGDGAVNVFDINAISAAWAPGLSPSVQPNVVFHLDASDQRTLTRIGAAQFDAASSQFLTTPDASELDFTTRMTAAFWVNPTTLGLDRNFLSKWTYPTDGSWTVSTALHTGQEDELAVWFATPTGTVASVAITTNANLVAGAWSHVAVVYDGTLSSNANRVKVYVNGQPRTLVFEVGSVPATLPISGAPLNVGKWGDPLERYADASMSSVALWSTALDSGAVSALYNQGVGQEYAELTAAQKAALVAWWSLEEPTGTTRVNSHGAGLALADTTNVAQRQLVSRWSDVGPQGLALTQIFDQRPDYLPTAIGNRGAVFFDGVNDLLRAGVADFPNTISGSVSFVVRFPEDASFESHFHAIFNSSDENGVGEYFFFSAYPTDPDTGAFKKDGVPRFRIRWRMDDMNVSMVGETVIEVAQSYVVTVSSAGVGDAYHMWINGVEQSLIGITGVPWYGSWYGELPGRDNVTTGALKRADGDSDLGRVQIGEIVVLGEAYTTQQIADVERYLAVKWGVTLGGSSGGAAAQLRVAEDVAQVSSENRAGVRNRFLSADQLATSLLSQETVPDTFAPAATYTPAMALPAAAIASVSDRAKVTDHVLALAADEHPAPLSLNRLRWSIPVRHAAAPRPAEKMSAAIFVNRPIVTS